MPINTVFDAIIRFHHYIINEEVDIEDVEIAEKYEKLLDLVDAERINEAENILFEGIDSKNPMCLELALLFYSYLNDKEDEFLEKCNFSRYEISEGIKQITKAYGCDGLSGLFL